MAFKVLAFAVGFAYPAFYTIKALLLKLHENEISKSGSSGPGELASGDQDVKTRWLVYWVVFGALWFYAMCCYVDRLTETFKDMAPKHQLEKNRAKIKKT